jgi:CheY-like chemotaxis protein
VIWNHQKRLDTSTPQVLVVDDYVDTADAISMVLSVSGFDSNVAYSGPSAIASVQRLHPEIILLDIWMPGMSGYEVAAQIRDSTDVSETVLIAHTALAGESELACAKQLGFDAFCVKPTDAEALSSLLKSFLQKRAPH